MNKEEIERILKDYAEMHEKLQKVIKQFEEESKEWKPEVEEDYHFVDHFLGVITVTYGNDEYDRKVCKYNKIFKTYAEAQEYADYLKAIAERTYKFSKEEWDNEKIKKYEILYCHLEKKFEIDDWEKRNTFSKFTFKTQEEAQAFIDEFGSMILKYEM